MHVPAGAWTNTNMFVKLNRFTAIDKGCSQLTNLTLVIVESKTGMFFLKANFKARVTKNVHVIRFFAIHLVGIHTQKLEQSGCPTPLLLGPFDGSHQKKKS